MYFLHLGSKAKFLQGSTINHQSSTINHQQCIHQPSTINHQSTVINHQSSTTLNEHHPLNRQSSINVISTLNGIKQSLLCRQFTSNEINDRRKH
jgi:hypothetical protein